MLRHDDLVALRGSDGVYRLAAEAMKDLVIPKEAKAVLTDVGLPRELEWIAFSGDTGVDSPLPTVMSLPGHPAELCRFGSAYDDLWCIELPLLAEVIEELPGRQDQDRRVLHVRQIAIPRYQRVSLRRHR